MSVVYVDFLDHSWIKERSEAWKVPDLFMKPGHSVGNANQSKYWIAAK